ncbi:unnamed protein product [Sphagnum jensenii]|uniref:superoxide dismutase n=1 Tax=Sphagnum jensenii TaxID=128206 RepID=A0ABP0W0E6_9BRYO
MLLHHPKHHQAYVTGFNKALEQLTTASDPRAIVALQSAINFNGGDVETSASGGGGLGFRYRGYAFCDAVRTVPFTVRGQSLQWYSMWATSITVSSGIILHPPKEGGGGPPEGNLASAIESQFGSLDNLIAKLSASGAGVQGSIGSKGSRAIAWH